MPFSEITYSMRYHTYSALVFVGLFQISAIQPKFRTLVGNVRKTDATMFSTQIREIVLCAKFVNLRGNVNYV